MKDRYKLMQEFQVLFLSTKVRFEENRYISLVQRSTVGIKFLVKWNGLILLNHSSESKQGPASLHHKLWTKLLNMSKLLLCQIHYGTI